MYIEKVFTISTESSGTIVGVVMEACDDRVDEESSRTSCSSE